MTNKYNEKKSGCLRDIAIGSVAAVIAGLAMNYLGGISPLDAWNWFAGLISSIFFYFTETTPIYRWLFGLLAIISLVAIISCAMIILKSLKEPT